MIDKLMEIWKQDKYVALYTNLQNTQRFMFGKLLYVTQTQFAFGEITPGGENDGICVRFVDDIFRIEVEGQYFKKMQRLCPSDVTFETIDWQASEDLFVSLFKGIQKEKIVSVELVDSGIIDVIGYPRLLNENCVEIKQVDEYGEDDGYSYIRTEDISQVSYDSEEERIIEKLR